MLKEAVKIFADLWLMMGRSQDRLGVTYSTRLPFLNNGEVLPLLTTASVNGIKTDLDLERTIEPDGDGRRVAEFDRGAGRTGGRPAAR